MNINELHEKLGDLIRLGFGEMPMAMDDTYEMNSEEYGNIPDPNSTLPIDCLRYQDGKMVIKGA